MKDDDRHLKKVMTIAKPVERSVVHSGGRVVPMLKAQARQTIAFLLGASSASGQATRQVAFARRFVPRALFDKILRSQFGLG